MARFDTMANVWSSAAIQLGLVSAAVANPYAATNADHLLLNELLNEVGLFLLNERPWVHLVKEATITTSNGDNDYDLPTDFDRVVFNTSYNRTTQRPIAPIGPQGWQYLQARGSSTTPEFYFRLVANEIQLYPTPSSTQTLKYEYVSRYWCRATASAAPDQEKCEVSTDVIHFDRHLFVACLKLFYRRAKGFDSTAAQQDYDRALTLTTGKDDVPRVLSMNGGSDEELYIGAPNLPVSGWGS